MGATTEAIADEIAKLRVGEIAPGLAQLALTLSEAVEGAEGATAKSNVARELRAVMEDLRKLAPVGEESDRVDELAKRRGDRIRARRA